MPRQRVIRSVLYNFLGTLTSRYSSFHGYWLFGFLIAEIDVLEVDLIVMQFVGDRESPVGVLTRRAGQAFAVQARVACVDKLVASASLFLKRGEAITAPIEQCERNGWELHVRAEAITHDGRRYVSERRIFVAAHDPAFEHRSYAT
jgi:hypothetical protein